MKTTDKNRANRMRYYRNNLELERSKMRSQHLRSKYGIDQQEFDRLLADQNFRCAICYATDNGNRNFCIDHDHETGAIRGLLCTNCNTAIGRFRDSPEVAERASTYLTMSRLAGWTA